MPLSFDHDVVKHLLPHNHPVLLIDRVARYDSDKHRLTAVKNVSQNDPYLKGHFPNHPIFPGILTIEAFAQASTLLMNLGALADGEGLTEESFRESLEDFTPPHSVLAESSVKHMSPIYPGHQVLLQTTMRKSKEGVFAFKVKALVNDSDLSSKGTVYVARTHEALA